MSIKEMFSINLNTNLYYRLNDNLSIMTNPRTVESRRSRLIEIVIWIKSYLE